ncbi:hypothetical protein QUA82_32570 [Microcoleus sp. F8-D3]
MAKNTDRNYRLDVAGNRSQAGNNDTVYNLTFDPLTGFPIKSGVFLARTPEQVSFDRLLDGGNKQNGGVPSPISTNSFEANFLQPTINSWSSRAFSRLVNLAGMVTNVNASFDLSQFLPPNLPKTEELQIFPYIPDADAFKGAASPVAPERIALFLSSWRNWRPRPG